MRISILITVIGILLNLSQTSVSNSEALSPSEPIVNAKPTYTTLFEDDFETDKGWTLFEEIVGGDDICYGKDIAKIERTDKAAKNGNYGMRLWPNHAQSIKNNHAIANKRISLTGVDGVWRYSVHARINPDKAEDGQAGPEFSMQNTRETSLGVFHTNSAGFQYNNNRFSSKYQQWSIWTVQEDGSAGWTLFTEQPLEADTWYHFTLEFDYDALIFKSFTVQGGGIDRTIDISNYPIASELKWNEEALWIALEAQNLWNNCGTAGIFDYIVDYDNVIVEKAN
jgi:hypothetical protein